MIIYTWFAVIVVYFGGSFHLYQGPVNDAAQCKELIAAYGDEVITAECVEVKQTKPIGI